MSRLLNISALIHVFPLPPPTCGRCCMSACIFYMYVFDTQQLLVWKKEKKWGNFIKMLVVPPCFARKKGRHILPFAHHKVKLTMLDASGVAEQLCEYNDSWTTGRKIMSECITKKRCVKV